VRVTEENRRDRDGTATRGGRAEVEVPDLKIRSAGDGTFHFISISLFIPAYVGIDIIIIIIIIFFFS
jgi:hypothetical protein